MRKAQEFERVAPEDVNLKSSDIAWLFSTLEQSDTEMHSLMIMRAGKICAEGWWKPYGPGIVHGLQSHTKTYAATAVGIAVTQGLMKLDDKIVDMFPEQLPPEISENLSLMTVHDVMCMGCGMDNMPRMTKNWISDFLATPVVHKPGTTYMYNSTGSTLLCAIVAKAVGMSASDYLKRELFDKIGINSDRLIWEYTPDGVEVGGGGLYATTEDNLRLMKLYADGGVWQGERILSEEFVKLATTNQNDSKSESRNNPTATDNFLGYGYQIWMSKPEGAYRADGAFGQFTIVLPAHDMIISITETANGKHWGQQTLDIIWQYVDMIGTASEKQDSNSEAVAKLRNMTTRLALPAVNYQPYSEMAEIISGRVYDVLDSGFQLGMSTGSWLSGREPVEDIKRIQLIFVPGLSTCGLKIRQAEEELLLEVALDGSRAENTIDFYTASRVLLSGAWIDKQKFEIRARWIQTCFEKTAVIDFSNTDEPIISSQMVVGDLALFTAGENVEGIRAIKSSV